MFPFKCQVCGAQATHKFTKLVGGKVEEVYYCKEHADQNNNYFPKSQDMQSVINAMLKNLLENKEEGAVSVSDSQQETVEDTSETCPSCGLHFSEYRKTLLLGCSNCYDAFQVKLTPELKRYHGAINHKGRMPGSMTDDEENKLQVLVELRKRMDDSITREDFQEAARLRDQIRDLEKDN